MYTLDANIFVRSLDPYDPEHATCTILIERLDQRIIPVVVPLLVLAEVAGVVSRTQRDPIRARLAVDWMNGLGCVRLQAIDAALAQVAADLAGDLALSGADACYVAVARQAGCTLVSLDRTPRERAQRVIPTRTPAEALAELG